MSTPAHSNRLIGETSPYLLQHAHNPVDWYPWGEEALATARRDDRPILLSIGYSACHWCHVMERESFEDEEVARVMNEHFVCIKVDREERPDLDKVYQTAHQILTQRPGGWPLTMFLAPEDRIPYFGGTYFPKMPGHGLPGLIELLREAAAAYQRRRADIAAQAVSLREIFTRLESAGPAPSAGPGEEALAAALVELHRQFDPRHGGFGRAPKFPHPTSLELCLRLGARADLAGRAGEPALPMARATLRSMARGGIYDQIGGGFYRYSVDERWTIPHFEKMLYDNAQLLALYADAAVATGESLFRRVARETADWVMAEMQSADGGYYSTLDADSQGHEGRYYVWDAEELRSLLDANEWEVVRGHYGLHGTPNFEDRWHLRVETDEADLAEALHHPPAEIARVLAGARATLRRARARRVRPARDEKILTAWNALMIKAMARAGRLLESAELIESADRAATFLRARLWRDGRLFASYKDGHARHPAYLDDYAFLIDACLERLQARFRGEDLEFAVALAEVLLDRFRDSGGGFYFTADDHERLLYRPKPTADDALPSGNGVAALALLRLGHLLGETRYLEAAEATVTALYPQRGEPASAHASVLLALDEMLHPTQTIVLRGQPEAMEPWQARARRHYAPWRLVLGIPAWTPLPEALAARAVRGEVVAYVCRGHTCEAPTTRFEDFERELARSELAPTAGGAG